MGELSVSLMGLEGAGRELLQALVANPQVRVVAVADRNPDVLAEVGEQGRWELYDDYRLLVVQSPTDLVFVTAPPYASHEHVKLAGQRGSHVWRVPPMARNVEQAVGLAEAFERSGRKLLVGTCWRLMAPYRALLAELARLAGLYLVRASTVRACQTPLGWRGDSVRAGGGVLLHQAYEAVDCIVHLLGLPEAVLASCSRLAVTQTAQSYDTEDTAAALLRYPKGVAGLVAASWLSQPPEEVFCLHGSGGSAMIDGQGLVLRDARGEAVATAAHEGGNVFVRQVEAAVAAAGGGASSPGAPGLPSVGEQLRTMAVIEAAYLSARTGHPESPAALLEVHGIRVGGERPGAASAVLRPDSEPAEP